MGFQQKIRPWMIAALLAVAGIAGAVIVSLAARAQHQRDRRDIASFQHSAMATIDDAYDAHKRLKAIEPAEGAHRADAAGLTDVRRRLEAARHSLSDSKIAIPGILIPTYQEYLNGIAQSLRALGAIEDGLNAGTYRAEDANRFTQLWNGAQKHYDAARAAFAALLCRAGAPGCVTK